MGERPLTPSQVADLFGVSVVTVAAWSDAGLLPHFRTPGGQRRFRKGDVERFLEVHGTDAAEATA